MQKRSIGGGLRTSATLKNLKEPIKLKDHETKDLEVCIEDDDELTEKPNKPAGGDEESKKSISNFDVSKKLKEEGISGLRLLDLDEEDTRPAARRFNYESILDPSSSTSKDQSAIVNREYSSFVDVPVHPTDATGGLIEDGESADVEFDFGNDLTEVASQRLEKAFEESIGAEKYNVNRT